MGGENIAEGGTRPAATSLLLKDLPEVLPWIAFGAIHPDADVVNHRSQPRLPQVGGPDQQNQLAVGSNGQPKIRIGNSQPTR